MDFNFAEHVKCEECGTIYRELLNTWRAARIRFRETWLASGKTGQDFRDALRSMLPELLRDETRQRELLHALHENAPEVARAERRMAEHEAATGHSVLAQGWRNLGFRDLSELL
jgi:hypothetical protein